jgi:hypothetical protein
MSEAQKLAALLLHLELNPDELKRYQADEETMIIELKHFGLSDETIRVVLHGSLEEFGKLFWPIRKQQAFGAAAVEPSRRKK